MKNYRVPSNAHRWLVCTNYAPLREAAGGGVPQDNSTAGEGILAHQVVAKTLKAFATSGTIAYDCLREAPSDMAEKLTPYVEMCAYIMKREMVFGGDPLSIEREFPCKFLSDDMRTVVDFAMLKQSHRTLVVVDLKYGHNKVEVFENPQLLIEARALYDHYKANNTGIDQIVLIIYQPNGRDAEVPKSQWIITSEEMLTRTDEFVRVYNGDERVCRTGPHCRRCELAGSCPALRRDVKAIEAEMMDDSGIEEGLSGERVAELLKGMLNIESLVKAYGEGLRAMAEHMIGRGDNVPGWEVSQGRSNRHWIFDDPLQLKNLGGAMKISLTEEIAVSPAEAERRGFPKATIGWYTKRTPTQNKLRRVSTAKIASQLGDENE